MHFHPKECWGPLPELPFDGRCDNGSETRRMGAEARPGYVSAVAGRLLGSAVVNDRRATRGGVTTSVLGLPSGLRESLTTVALEDALDHEVEERAHPDRGDDGEHIGQERFHAAIFSRHAARACVALSHGARTVGPWLQGRAPAAPPASAARNAGGPPPSGWAGAGSARRGAPWARPVRRRPRGRRRPPWSRPPSGSPTSTSPGRRPGRPGSRSSTGCSGAGSSPVVSCSSQV